MRVQIIYVLPSIVHFKETKNNKKSTDGRLLLFYFVENYFYLQFVDSLNKSKLRAKSLKKNCFFCQLYFHVLR